MAQALQATRARRGTMAEADVVEVECAICKDNLLEDPASAVIFNPCTTCDVLYCRTCLEKNMSEYSNMCPVCRTKVRITRSMTVVVDGADRLRAHAARERATARPSAPARHAPGQGELALACVDQAYMRRRAEEDDEAASLALVASFAAGGPPPAPADDEPDDATKALLAEYAAEERAAREAKERADAQRAADEKLARDLAEADRAAARRDAAPEPKRSSPRGRKRGAAAAPAPAATTEDLEAFFRGKRPRPDDGDGERPRRAPPDARDVVEIDDSDDGSVIA